MKLMEQKQEEIKKFSCENPCVCFNLRKAARTITQIYDNMFRHLNLTATQAMILNSVVRFGPIPISQLSESLCTDRTTLTRNLKPLERDGMIAIQIGQDKRSREVMITAKGQTTLEKVVEIWKDYQARVTDQLGEKRLHSFLNELTNTLEEIQKI